MITIFAYNLATLEVKEEEVDYIKNGKAIRIRASNSKDKNNKTFLKFELTEREAERKICNYLNEEIELRESRLIPLQSLLKDLYIKNGWQ